SGNSGEATGLYRQALALEPGEETATNGLASLLIHADRLDRAGALLARALGRCPHDPNLWINRTVAALRGDDRDRARGFARAPVALAPALGLGHLYLGACYDEQDRSEAAFLRVLRLEPCSADALLGLSKLRLDADDLESALDL